MSVRVFAFSLQGFQTTVVLEPLFSTMPGSKGTSHVTAGNHICLRYCRHCMRSLKRKNLAPSGFFPDHGVRLALFLIGNARKHTGAIVILSLFRVG